MIARKWANLLRFSPIAPIDAEENLIDEMDRKDESRHTICIFILSLCIIAI